MQNKAIVIDSKCCGFRFDCISSMSKMPFTTIETTQKMPDAWFSDFLTLDTVRVQVLAEMYAAAYGK